MVSDHITGTQCLCVIVDEEVCRAAELHHGVRRNTARLPAGRRQLAALLVVSSHRHDTRRRDGTRKDHPDHRVSLLTLQGGTCSVDAVGITISVCEVWLGGVAVRCDQ